MADKPMTEDGKYVGPRGRTAPPKGFAPLEVTPPTGVDEGTLTGREYNPAAARQSFLDKLKALRPGSRPVTTEPEPVTATAPGPKGKPINVGAPWEGNASGLGSQGPGDQNGFLRRMFHMSGRDSAGEPKEMPQEVLGDKGGPWSNAKAAPPGPTDLPQNKSTLDLKLPGKSIIPSVEDTFQHTPESLSHTQGLASDFGKLLNKWGLTAEDFGKVEPHITSMFKALGPVAGKLIGGASAVGTGIGAYNEAKEDLPRLGHFLNPVEAAQSFPEIPGESLVDRVKRKGGDLFDDFSKANIKPAEAQEATQGTDTPATPPPASGDAPTAIKDYTNDTARGGTPLVSSQSEQPAPPQQSAMPDAIIARPNPSPGMVKGHVASKPQAKEAPLSDADIVGWNARNNPGFRQEGGTASFQPSAAPRQSDGILYVGNTVYMTDGQGGYTPVHTYGQK